jgi:ketosteroid isomerase-like protein
LPAAYRLVVRRPGNSIDPEELMRTVALIVLFLATACKGGVTREDPEAVRAIIDSMNKTIERLYAVGRIDSAAMFFAEDVWQMPPNSPPLVGRDSYIEFWARAVNWGTWQFNLDVQDVVVGDSFAVERGKYTLSFDAGSESPIPSSEDRGNYVVLWRLESDGLWRIVWDAPVSELPPGGSTP